MVAVQALARGGALKLELHHFEASQLSRGSRRREVGALLAMFEVTLNGGALSAEKGASPPGGIPGKVQILGEPASPERLLECLLTEMLDTGNAEPETPASCVLDRVAMKFAVAETGVDLS